MCLSVRKCLSSLKMIQIKYFNTFQKLTRCCLSVCFILSGILKLLDVRAFEREVALYGNAYIGDYIVGYSHEIAVVVCILELFLGTSILFRKYSIITGIVICVLMCFFTYLTILNLFFPPLSGRIEFCGCFGEFITFTPWQSFVKCLILLTLSCMYSYLEFKTAKKRR